MIDWSKYDEVQGAGSTDRMWPAKGEELEEGDTIEGRLIEKRENIGDNHSNVYTLETAEGEKVGVWGSAVLDSKLAGIAIGKMVAIEYLGKKPSPTKGRNPYKDFKVGSGVDVVGDGK